MLKKYIFKYDTVSYLLDRWLCRKSFVRVLYYIFTKQKVGKKKKKNKVLDFVKLEYYKEVLDFRNIKYRITFLIAQISG